MNINWIKVIVAAFFEVLWVIGFKHAEGKLEWGITIFSIVFSFYLMVSASRKLPVGTVYAAFVGLGTAGTVISEIMLFGELFRLEKMLLILMLLVGVIGLKLITESEPEKGGEC